MLTRRRFVELMGGGVGAAVGTGFLSADQVAQIKPGLPPHPQSDIENQLVSAQGVLVRALGRRAKEFHLDFLYNDNGSHVARVSASHGHIYIKGSSGVALCRAAYDYLRNYCSAMITWSGTHLNLPATFPPVAEYPVECTYKFVQYYNPCTFGYSTPFWDWNRWQQELDWMALHGVTMPLALEGQEAIWQSVWKSFGICQAELDHFSTGPAHLPWHRMGNINNFDGPLPQGWIEQKKTLQAKILDRMRSLGMTPVAPAFSGFVPEGFKRVRPNAQTFTLLWGAGDYPTMPRESKTFILHPAENGLYRQIGGEFIRRYTDAFGPVQYYLADTFNELKPPVTVENRYRDLAQFGRTVYDGILAGNPDGRWVMQGWLFADDPVFWDNPSIEALLSEVPSDRMVILDYTNDASANKRSRFHGSQWKQHHAFFGKQWINGMLQTYGGNNNVKGDIPLIATEPLEVLDDPDKGNLVGWSMDPEGIENNEVVYELMTDIGWRRDKIDVDEWIASYCNARYGGNSSQMKNAWRLLIQSAYGAGSWDSKHHWQVRPSLELEGEYKKSSQYSVDSGPVFQEAVEGFLSCSGQFSSNELYRNDLIELASQSVGGSVDRLLGAACEAHKSGHFKDRDEKAKASLKMLLRIDALMNLRTDRRLETWVSAARSWAITASEADYYDQNSRRLITFWGWSGLADYGARVWSGLIRDYYVGRWALFFQELQQNIPSSLDVWEETWLSSSYRPSKPLAVDNFAAEVRRMLDICKSWAI